MDSEAKKTTGEVKSVFLSALEKRAGQEREAFLDSACGDDGEFRNRVESLLTAHERAGKFLEPSSDVAPGQTPLAEGVGTVIGRYKLLEKIGEGGMAVVYMAEQERPIRRKVALKLIKLGMDTKQVIGRFDLERQALAMMDHPNIAKVLDAGATETGRPYFVMELVKGVSITEYCDKNRLSTKERLDLFIQVCHAVQHAHQKGIIHRDIKPTNVLVTMHDGKAVPKVIDFGIAKATKQRLTEKTLFTRYAQMIGTPAYMSPEQAEMSELGVDTRTDIYSLGVLLYELLTGATPFSAEELRKGGYLEIQRIISKEEPPKPSTKLSTLGETLTDIAEYRKTNPDTLQKQISGDLDWIVMKTLEKDRARRYETVNELQMDVNRHLSSEPVMAAAPSITYRLRKFIRRNRVTVTIGCLIAIMVLVIISALSVSTVMIWREKGRTEAQGNRAEANLSLALEALDEIYLGVAKERLPKKAEIEEADRELLRKAVIFYERFAEQNRTVVEARYETAKAYRRVGEIHRRLGEYEQAVEACLNACQALEKLVEEFPQAPDYRKELAESNIKLGLSYYRLDRYEEAEQAYRRAFNLADKLVAEFGDVPAYRKVLADSHHESGRVLWAKGQFDGAEQVFRRALPIWEELTREFPNVPEYRSGLARSYHALEVVLLDKGKLDESEQACHSVLALWEELVREFPDVPLYRSSMAMTYNNLGATLAAKGELDEVEQAYRSATAIQEELVRDYPSVPRYRSSLAFYHKNMGAILTAKGEFDESEQAYRSAIAIYEELGREFPNVPEYPSTMAASHQSMGDMLTTKGQLDEAEQVYLSAIAIREELARQFPNVPGYRHGVAIALKNLGFLLQQDPNRLDETKDCYLKALKIARELVELPKVPADYRKYLTNIGWSINNLAWRLATNPDVKLRDPTSAVELARKAVQAAPENASFLNTLGVAHYRAGQWEDTITAAGKSRELGAGGHEEIARFFIAMAHWQLGEKDEARRWYDQAVDQMNPHNEELRRFQAEAAELLGAVAQKPWATFPQPGDGAPFHMTLDADFRWTPGLDAVTHSVYFGTDPENLTLLSKVQDASYDKLPTLQRRQWYCWRVDSVKSDGSVIKGKLWSFSTGTMAGWWEFERAEGRTVIDSSGSGLDGKLVGDARIISDPERGGVLSLDGDGDYIDCGNDWTFDLTSDITVAVWIKVNVFDRDWQAIITKGDSAWRLARKWSTDFLAFHCTGIKSSSKESFGPFSHLGVEGTVGVNDGKWHHAVAVYDGKKIFLYVDGVLDNSEDASGTIDINHEPVYIGGNAQKPGRKWNGLIDDVRVYSYALTEAEVEALYAGNGPGPNEKPQWLIDRLNSDSKVSAEPDEASKSSGQNGKEVEK